ncbi:MAG: LapA family protein [Spirochaetota bacterium]|jgi:DNA repair exonuclease SbcCD ATPase subunit|nr:LapA family protein [Spirochaetota bacterium]
MEEILKSCVGHCIFAFLIGLLVGLIFLSISKIRNALAKRELKQQIKELKNQIAELHKIIVDAGVSHSSQVNELKEKNDNMEKTINALNRKPNRNELKTLYLYDKAVHIMYGKVPGFSVMWEDTLKEAQKEMEKIESGKKKLFEKIFHPSLFSAKSLVENVDTTDVNESEKND